MQIRYGLYVLLATVTILAVIFAAVRAWGAIGLAPAIFAALSLWFIQVALRLEGTFEKRLMTFAAVLFGFGTLVLIGELLLRGV
jgi:hypothetical protein